MYRPFMPIQRPSAAKYRNALLGTKKSGLQGVTLDGLFEKVFCHAGRISGFMKPSSPAFMHIVPDGDPLGDLVCQPSYDYVMEKYLNPVTNQPMGFDTFGWPLRRFCWFEPIAISNGHKRIGLFYIESFDDTPVRVFQVLEPKEGRAAPFWFYILPAQIETSLNAPEECHDLHKLLRRARGRKGAGSFGVGKFYDSPIIPAVRGGKVLFQFPGFKVSEEKLRPVLWKFKRAGVNEVPLKLLQQGLQRC